MNNSLLRILYAIVIGIVLVVWPDMAAEYIVRTIGFLFIIVGIISLMAYGVNRRRYKKIVALEAEQAQLTGDAEPTEEQKKRRAPRFPLEGIGSILLGVWLNISPSTVVNILMFVLGFIILMGGVWQLASLLNARRWTKVPLPFYILPTLILLAGLFVVANPSGAFDSMATVIGATFLVFALFELINWFKFARTKPKITDAEIVEEIVEK
jgi:uncharacterized membrane protein HdeD (DUF308 family)